MPRCCARPASTAASPFRRPTRTAAERSSRSTRGRCRSATTSTSTPSRPPLPGRGAAPLAASTPGRVGGDLANLANEAALLAARRGHETVVEADFTDSLEKIVLGAPRGLVLPDEEKRRTAYHESGHALVGMLTPGADPVRKVSIIPRTMS